MTTLLDIWKNAWVVMRKWGMPLEDYQREQIVGFQIQAGDEPSKKAMAYFITEHFEGMKKHNRSLFDSYKMPEEILELIKKYKYDMMELWGWPAWGYNDVEKKDA